MKVVLLNEVVKHLLFNTQTLTLEDFLIHLNFSNIHII
jgi:hypothetical protein